MNRTFGEHPNLLREFSRFLREIPEGFQWVLALLALFTGVTMVLTVAMVVNSTLDTNIVKSSDRTEAEIDLMQAEAESVRSGSCTAEMVEEAVRKVMYPVLCKDEGTCY